MMADAIVRSLYRLLRQPQAACSNGAPPRRSQKGQRQRSAGYYRFDVAAPSHRLGRPGARRLLAHSTGVAWSALFALFWARSPAFAWFVSQSAETEDRLALSPEDYGKLRSIARAHLALFRDLRHRRQNFLPPDNFQEMPHPVVAERTSPTNIGVYLLSVMSARDFGWIGFDETVERIEETISTIDRMPKATAVISTTGTTPTTLSRCSRSMFRRSTAAISPAISSPFRAACREWAEAPSAHLQGDLDGTARCRLASLREACATLPDDRRQCGRSGSVIEERIVGIRRALETVKREPEFASIRMINLAVLAGDIHKLAAPISSRDGKCADRANSPNGRPCWSTPAKPISPTAATSGSVDALRGG